MNKSTTTWKRALISKKREYAEAIAQVLGKDVSQFDTSSDILSDNFSPKLGCFHYNGDWLNNKGQYVVDNKTWYKDTYGYPGDENGILIFEGNYDTKKITQGLAKKLQDRGIDCFEFIHIAAIIRHEKNPSPCIIFPAHNLVDLARQLSNDSAGDDYDDDDD